MRKRVEGRKVGEEEDEGDGWFTKGRDGRGRGRGERIGDEKYIFKKKRYILRKKIYCFQNSKWVRLENSDVPLL